MKKITYDLKALSAAGGVDAVNAVLNMPSEAYYHALLNAFIKKSPKFLLYSPDVVAFSDDVKKDFLESLKRLRAVFEKLGITIAGDCFNDLAEAAENSKSKALSDKIVHLKAIVEMVVEYAQKAQIITDAVPLVMAVDDMPEMLAVVQEALKGEYDCLAVTSVSDAQKALGARIPDLFLLDVEMPEESGLELAEFIQADFALDDIPILFLTAIHDKDIVVEAKRLGGKGYILKPVDKQTLIKRIAFYLNE